VLAHHRAKPWSTAEHGRAATFTALALVRTMTFTALTLATITRHRSTAKHGRSATFTAFTISTFAVSTLAHRRGAIAVGPARSPRVTSGLVFLVFVE
jgi:hypothetical protein